jgi:hypothetical protein
VKKFFLSAALLAASFVPAAYSASIVDLGTISNLSPERFAFADGFDFHSISFEVDNDSLYKFTIADLNTGPGSIGGVISLDVMDKLGLDIRKDTVGGLSASIASGGFDQPLNDMAMFTAALEAGKRYVGLFVGFTNGNADIGEASLAVSAVPIPAPVLLLASAIGGLVVVRRRRETTTA